MRIHLIAIGGAVMHNLAMALHNKGIRVSGSDDEIFEPSRSRLEEYGLLPGHEGWHPERITAELDGVIVGMHARNDNPELIRARELGLRIWSFPEYIYEQSKEKKRVVIGGSHGKTTVTAMIMHVLRYNHFPFDYMVGSQLEGFETMVKLSNDAPVIILEGDEYLASPLDPRPKFHLYHPHVAVLTGIAWDHMNVFPTWENYVEQFMLFTKKITPDGILFWYKNDPELEKIAGQCDCQTESYTAQPAKTKEETTLLLVNGEQVPVRVFGNHNMQNIAAARLVCQELGISGGAFYEAISSFTGAARRQELITSGKRRKVYLDFAHSPSKVKATVQGFREMYPDEKIIAILELHTFSSLNKAFLPQYAGSLDVANKTAVFYSPDVVKRKNLPVLDEQYIKDCFQNQQILVLTDPDALKDYLLSLKHEGIILLMSSGSFGGLDLRWIFNEKMV